LSGILFGLAPALSAGRSDLSASMKGAGRPKAISFSRGSANALVVFQIAMALPLLIVCGLFARTLENLMAQKLGFSDDQVLVARINPHVAGYTSAELPVLYQTLLSGLSSLPGVVSCTFDATTPLGGSESAGNISFQGSSKGASGDKSDEASAHIDKVGERYFETLGTPILLGRDISPEDIREKRRVAVINQTMAQQYFGKSSPLGQRYSKGSPFDPNRAFEIVGVSADARYYSLRAAIPATAFDAEVPLDREASLILRVVGNPTAIRAQASKRIGELATRLPPVRVVPLRNQVEDQFQQDRAVVDLSSVFGGFALVLASIGLYGTMSYRVSRRTNEIGVRMALGAQRSYVLWLVMRESAILVAFGLPTGALLALASTRLIRNQLFGLSPSDPFTIVLAASVLAGIAMIAGYIPARRAMKVDPMVALRYE
jgi:predicted permease